MRGGLNTYAYVFNNPLYWIDPLGLDVTYGYHISTSTVNPFTSGGGKVHGPYNQQTFFGGNNVTTSEYTYTGNGVGLDVGASIESVVGFGEGEWSGNFSSVNWNYLWFSGSFFWSPDEGGWWGFSYGLSLGLPGLAYEETVYTPIDCQEQ